MLQYLQRVEQSKSSATVFDCACHVSFEVGNGGIVYIRMICHLFRDLLDHVYVFVMSFIEGFNDVPISAFPFRFILH